MGWLRVDRPRANDNLKLLPEHFLCYVDAEDDDSTEASWRSLASQFKELMDFCLGVLKV
jgi:hypothetical protein